MSVLAGNLAALAPRMPDLARLLGEAGLTAGNPLEIIASAAGIPTARSGGTWLHSRHDPRREAAAQVARETDDETSAALILGFGLGYAAEEVLARWPGTAVLVIETDPALFQSALSCRDLRSLLASPRCLFHVGGPAEHLPALLETLPLDKPAFLRLRPEIEKDPAGFRAAEEVIRSYLLRREINVNTLKRFGRLWVRNLCRNITAFAASPGVSRLAGAFQGVPALVLAGGPTLDEAGPRLRELAERMLVIAVNTSLGPCLAAGVSPDFTVVVDPQYWASRSLDWARPPGGFLVAEPSTHPRVFRADRGHGAGQQPAQVLLCSSLFPLGERMEAAVGERGKLGAGGSVTTSAWDLARLLGCAPIYAAGLDLGFPGLRTHCRGAFFEQARHAAAGRLSPAETAAYAALREIGVFPVRSAGGGWTPTDRRMLLYKWWFENALAMRPDIQARTLSAAGAAIEGMRLADMAEALALPALRQRINELKAERLEACRQAVPADRPRDLAVALEEILRELQELEQAAAEGSAATSALKAVMESRGDSRRALAALDVVDRRILDVSSRNIAGFLIQSVIHRVQGGADRAGDARAVLARSAEMYGGMADSARFQRELLSRARDELRDLEQGRAATDPGQQPQAPRGAGVFSQGAVRNVRSSG